MKQAFKCNHKNHARCEGRNIKMTEKYTREFCRMANLCFFHYICDVNHIEKFPRWLQSSLRPNNVDSKPTSYIDLSDKRTVVNHDGSRKVVPACPAKFSAEDLRRLDAFVVWMAPKKVPAPMPLHVSPEGVNRVRQI